MGRFYGMVYLSAKCHIFIIWWEDALWKTFWTTISRTDYSIWFTGWILTYNITAKDQSRIHQFGKHLPGLFFGYAEGEFGRVKYWPRTWRSWRRWTNRKSTRKDSLRKRWYFFKENFSNRRWTNQISWRRSGLQNIHLGTASTNSRRKLRQFSWRIRIVSSTTSRLISGCRWSDKWFLVHVGKLQTPPSRRTKSQTLLAERRIIPYSTEIHRRIQNY